MPLRSARKATEIANRRRTVSDLYLRGQTMHEIAERLNCSTMTVSFDLKAVRAEWVKQAVANMTELKSRELAKVDRLEVEYWASWERSQGRRELTVTERTNAGPWQRDRAQVRREERDGNPAFLAGIQWCINKRCELLGLNAPIENKNSSVVEFKVHYGEIHDDD